MNIHEFEHFRTKFSGPRFHGRKRKFSQHSRKFSARISRNFSLKTAKNIKSSMEKFQFCQFYDFRDHFSVKIAILSSNLNDFDQPDMSNRFKGAEGQFRCINRTLLRMRVSISKFSIFKIFIFPLRNQKRSSNLFLTFRYASFFLSNLLGVYSTKCQNLMSESSEMSENWRSYAMIQISCICNQLLAEIVIFIRKLRFSILNGIDPKMKNSIEI